MKLDEDDDADDDDICPIYGQPKKGDDAKRLAKRKTERSVLGA